jgi:hypothetical protein
VVKPTRIRPRHRCTAARALPQRRRKPRKRRRIAVIRGAPTLKDRGLALVITALLAIVIRFLAQILF